jgi:hypothetical protein
MLYLFLLFIYADAISGNHRDLPFKLLTPDIALLSDREVTLFEDRFVVREGPTAREADFASFAVSGRHNAEIDQGNLTPTVVGKPFSVLGIANPRFGYTYELKTWVATDTHLCF